MRQRSSIFALSTNGQKTCSFLKMSNGFYMVFWLLSVLPSYGNVPNYAHFYRCWRFLVFPLAIGVSLRRYWIPLPVAVVCPMLVAPKSGFSAFDLLWVYGLGFLLFHSLGILPSCTVLRFLPISSAAACTVVACLLFSKYNTCNRSLSDAVFCLPSISFSFSSLSVISNLYTPAILLPSFSFFSYIICCLSFVFWYKRFRSPQNWELEASGRLILGNRLTGLISWKNDYKSQISAIQLKLKVVPMPIWDSSVILPPWVSWRSIARSQCYFYRYLTMF